MGCVWPGSYKSFSLRLTHGARKAGRIRRRPATDGTALLFTNRRRAVEFSEWADALDALRTLLLIASADDCSLGGSCTADALTSPRVRGSQPDAGANPHPRSARNERTGG